MGFKIAPEAELRDVSRQEVDAAFTIIYSRWRNRGEWDEQAWGTLWRYCRSVIRGCIECPGEANEVLSNVATSLKRTFERRPYVQKPTAYINTVIRSAIADSVRERERRARLGARALEHSLREIEGTEYLPASEIAALFSEVIRRLNMWVVTGQISAKAKEIFLMHHAYGYTVRDIAGIFHISAAAVGRASKGIFDRLKESFRREEAML